MYLDQTVRIPDSKNGITKKKIKGITYVYYSYGRQYDPVKKYSIPKCTSIGKLSEENEELMYPNTSFYKFFPEIEIPETKGEHSRSGCLRIGTYLVLRKLIAAYGLDKQMDEILGKDSGLFFDLAAYSIVTENNAGQYYPDYAYNHPLFTEKMKVYSDSKVSDFINGLTRDQSIEFQNQWTSKFNKDEQIYISYDSTNKNCQAGDIELLEFGHAKVDTGKPIVNYSIAYDMNNAVPLYYENYAGSINDVSQLQTMVKKAEGYKFKNIGFVLDRGYFSKANIHAMDAANYDFIIMVKGMKDMVSDLVRLVKGRFEDRREYSIRDYKVSGYTVKRKLFPSDEKERYFHIYYSDYNKGKEKEDFQSKIDEMEEALKVHEGTEFTLPSTYEKYFEPIYYHEDKEDEIFMFAKEKYQAINNAIDLCGYFVLITSRKMTAEDALELYKGRDPSEKLFRGDKSYLGNKSFRVQSTESMRGKIFIEFVALILRNRFYTLLKEQMKAGTKQNYLTVPAAIRELEKIELIRQSDKEYRLDSAITKTQKEILKAFDMTAANVREQAIGLSKELKGLTVKV